MRSFLLSIERERERERERESEREREVYWQSNRWLKVGKYNASSEVRCSRMCSLCWWVQCVGHVFLMCSLHVMCSLCVPYVFLMCSLKVMCSLHVMCSLCVPYVFLTGHFYQAQKSVVVERVLRCSRTCSLCWWVQCVPYVFLMCSLCVPYVFLMCSWCVPYVFLMCSLQVISAKDRKKAILAIRFRYSYTCCVHTPKPWTVN
jgi:hypothetical protein